MKKILLGLLSIFSLALINPVFAGGGLIEPISIAGPNGQAYASVGQAYILTFRVSKYDGEPYNSSVSYCKQCPAKIVFFDPQNGDIINPLSDKTDDNGEISVKLASGVPYIRYAHAVVTLPSGEVYEGSKVVMNFTGKMLFYPDTEKPEYNLPKNNSVQPDPGQRDIARQPGIGQAEQPVYGKTPVKTTPQRLPAVPASNGQSETPDFSKTDVADATTSSTDLENKGQELEKRLDESQQKQSALEQSVNNIMSWIKSVFPFFK